MKSPFEYVWGYKFGKLTVKGTSDFCWDVFAVFISILLLLAYPSKTNDPMLAWIGCVIIIMLLISVLFQRLNHMVLGHYEHYIEEEPGA